MCCLILFSLDTSGCIRSTVNLNPLVGLGVTYMTSPRFALSTAHVIIHLSAVRSCLNIHDVAPHQEAFHWRAPYIRLVGVRICCRCVPGRLPFTSCTHLEAKVIQKQHRCFNYYSCIQRCGRLLPSIRWSHSVTIGKVLLSLAFSLKRRISMFRKLQRLSRGRVALRKGDIPKVREDCGAWLMVREGLTCCVACARLCDTGVYACLSDFL